MPRIFRHKAERSWLELRRSADDDSPAKARLYPPQQVVNRWESQGGLEVLYELKSGDFARADFSEEGEFQDGYQIPRSGSHPVIRAFFEAHDLFMPWHLSSENE